MLGMWHFKDMPSGKPKPTWIEFRSYKCSEGHLWLDEMIPQGDRDPVCCLRSTCRGSLRRLHDVERPPIQMYR